MKKMIRYFQLSTATFYLFSTFLFYMSSKKKSIELGDLRHDKEKLDSLYKDKSETLSKYLIISLELNTIVDDNRSAREQKMRNRNLLKLMQEVN